MPPSPPPDPTPGRTVLVCRDLRKSFDGLVAVDGVGFQIAAGETYGLLGPNGAGKTTTISMVCGLLARDGGEVLLEGRELDTRSTDAKASIGYVPQELALYPDLTARENLRFFGKLYGLTGRDLESRVDEVLRVIDLVDRADDRVEHYSGGMQRRLNIGLGLLNRPSLLILDEPTVGVDPQSRNAILSSVERFREQGMAVLYTTHYMEEAERLCDRVGIIDHGQLKAEGTRRELVAMVGERDRVSLSATGDLDAAEQAVRAVPGVHDASRHEAGLDVVAREAHRVLPAVLAAVAGAGAHVTSVEIAEPNLEAVFLHLTGRALRG
ncbi:MAG: ABC transporter ATP-binding protein [Candidatus Velamenicoccus archaeovorus]